HHDGGNVRAILLHQTPERRGGCFDGSGALLRQPRLHIIHGARITQLIVPALPAAVAQKPGQPERARARQSVDYERWFQEATNPLTNRLTAVAVSDLAQIMSPAFST